MVARIFIYAALKVAGLILLDIVSHGALSNLIAHIKTVSGLIHPDQDRFGLNPLH